MDFNSFCLKLQLAYFVFSSSAYFSSKFKILNTYKRAEVQKESVMSPQLKEILRPLYMA